jgi:hypothetical protein
MCPPQGSTSGQTVETFLKYSKMSSRSGPEEQIYTR